ncbi:MAG: branched-chain amino acid transport system permease protein [Nitriliruptoraceae bacterium]|jgi:branched-chain amino acid transport system permease protein
MLPAPRAWCGHHNRSIATGTHMSTTTAPARRLKKPGVAATTWIDTFLVVFRVLALLVIAIGLVKFGIAFAKGETVSGAQLLNLVVAGLAQGSMYGLIALGYSMVYGVLGFINFAHGEVFMAGAVAGFVVADATARVGMWESAFPLALLIVMASAVLVSTGTAVLLEKIAYRRLRGSPRLISLITSIGASFFLQNLVLNMVGSAAKSYPVAPSWMTNRIEIGSVSFNGVQIFVIALALSSMYILNRFVTGTKTGRAMRAVAEDKEIAALMGIDVDKTIRLVFVVGGVMAGVAAVAWSLLIRQVSYIVGFIPGIKAFTAAVVGGIGNLVGAMAGGLFLGTIESVGPQMILEPLGIPAASQLKNVIAFGVLVLVLLFKPAGLFGELVGSENRA